MEAVHLDVFLLLDDALPLHLLRLALAGAVLPNAVGDDHVAKLHIPALAGADTAHGEALDVMGFEEIRGGDDGRGATHG